MLAALAGIFSAIVLVVVGALVCNIFWGPWDSQEEEEKQA